MTAVTTPRFVLPGRWGRVDLASEASSRRSIRTLVEQATHRKEELATMRAELRARFQGAADVARLGGASDFFVAFELAPGIPLPAWLAVFEPDVTGEELRALGLSDLATTLELGIRNTAAAVAQRQPASAGIQVVRQTWRRTGRVEAGAAAQSVEFLQVDYWLAAASPNRIALLTFATALTEYEEEMLGLFDAVISTTRWPSPAPVPTLAAEVTA